MRRLTLFLFFLFFSLSQVLGQGNVTTYEYDEGGNVVKRSVTLRRATAARARAASDTARFTSIIYDRTRSVVTILVSKPVIGKEVRVSICNAATRLLIDSFSFIGGRHDLDISLYLKGFYVVETTCEGRSASRKIAK